MVPAAIEIGSVDGIIVGSVVGVSGVGFETGFETGFATTVDCVVVGTTGMTGGVLELVKLEGSDGCSAERVAFEVDDCSTGTTDSEGVGTEVAVWEALATGTSLSEDTVLDDMGVVVVCPIGLKVLERVTVGSGTTIEVSECCVSLAGSITDCDGVERVVEGTVVFVKVVSVVVGSVVVWVVDSL